MEANAVFMTAQNVPCCKITQEPNSKKRSLWAFIAKFERLKLLKHFYFGADYLGMQFCRIRFIHTENEMRRSIGATCNAAV